MITLYRVPVSHYCAKVQIALLEKGLPFDLPPLPGGSTRSAEFLAVNPLGKVPLLLDGDFRLGESEVIVEYLEDRFPTPPLLPKDPRTRARSRWLSRFHDLYLGPQLTMLYLGIASRREDPAMIAEVDKLAELLTTLERSIEPNPYFLGEQFYLCDASFCLSYTYVAPLTAAYGKPLLPSQTPKFAKWFEHVASRPSVVEVLAAARTALG